MPLFVVRGGFMRVGVLAIGVFPAFPPSLFFLVKTLSTRMGEIGRKPSHTVVELASARKNF